MSRERDVRFSPKKIKREFSREVYFIEKINTYSSIFIMLFLAIYCNI